MLGGDKIIEKKDSHRINESIKTPQVRVIDAEGNQLGVLKTTDALKTANEKGFDLVEVSPNATPPVCRLMDYGKYKYQQTKKTQKKKTVVTSVVKEIKFRPFTGEHDLEVKIRHIQNFLEKGMKVKVSVIFRGREMKFQENGETIMQKIIDSTEELGTAEKENRMQGNSMLMHLIPKKTK